VRCASCPSCGQSVAAVVVRVRTIAVGCEVGVADGESVVEVDATAGVVLDAVSLVDTSRECALGVDDADAHEAIATESDNRNANSSRIFTTFQAAPCR